MVKAELVQTEARRLHQEYKAEFGVASMIPQRKEPMTRRIMIDTLLGAPDGFNLGSSQLKWSSRAGRSLRGLVTTLASTGFRKSEVTVDRHGQVCDADCLSRSALQFKLRGTVYAAGDAPRELLRSPQAGDCAILTPVPSKADPYDMVWGGNPIWLPFIANEPLCAFSALADIELHDAVEPGTRGATGMFTADDGLPFSGNQLDNILRHLLLRHYPAATVRLYSWHSFRIWLACAMLAAKCTRAEIQAVCRWQTEQSLNIYARMGEGHYSDLLCRSLVIDIDAARAQHLARAVPFIDRRDLVIAAAEQAAAQPVPDDNFAAAIDADVPADDDADEDVDADEAPAE